MGKEEREDRPNAVTLITLRLPTEMRLCQVAIISYTRWPLSAIPGGHFSIPLNPAPQGLNPRRAIIRPPAVDELPRIKFPRTLVNKPKTRPI